MGYEHGSGLAPLIAIGASEGVEVLLLTRAKGD
jgi:hypothetical protein